jgi:hypothetical protein
MGGECRLGGTHPPDMKVMRFLHAVQAP